MALKRSANVLLRDTQYLFAHPQQENLLVTRSNSTLGMFTTKYIQKFESLVVMRYITHVLTAFIE